MSMFKNRIWFIFIIIVIISLFALGNLSYKKYTEIYQEHQTQLQFAVEQIYMSVENDIKQIDLLLNIIANNLIQKKNYLNKEKIEEVFENILIEGTNLAGYGLIGKDGNFIVMKSDKILKDPPNLLKNPINVESINETFKSDQIILGRTYFFKYLNKWVIPIRKSLKNEKGEPIAVIATGIDIENDISLANNYNLPESRQLFILRASDLYFQYISHVKDKNKAYSTPLPKELFEQNFQAVLKNNNITNGEFEPHKPYSSRVVGYNNKDFLISVIYCSNLNLYFYVKTDIDVINNEVIESLKDYIFPYFSAIFIVFLLFLRLASAQKESDDKLLYQATHDLLTDLPNRAYLYRYIDKWIYQDAPKFIIYYVDLDNFKNINDSFGHMFGDKVIKEVAHKLTKFDSNKNEVIRHGGDEFLILTHYEDDHQLKIDGQNIISTLGMTTLIDNIEMNIGASVGAVMYPEHGESIDELLASVDIAMSRAKKKKNSFSLFDINLYQENMIKLEIEQQLRLAQNKNQFYMVYQPQVNTKGALVGVEALIRWENDKLGFVPPDKFITIAESIGYMPNLGEFIIERVFEDIKEIEKVTNQEFTTSINISARQLFESNFIQFVIKMLDHHQVKSQRLIFEITESLFIEDLNSIIEIFDRIKRLGIRLSLDDFGTGYSSLNMLKKLPLDELKIDKSFVGKLETDSKEQAMVRSIIDIGKNLSLKLVAEGVEEERQIELLREYKCDIFQGYYYSKPLVKSDLIQYINHL